MYDFTSVKDVEQLIERFSDDPSECLVQIDNLISEVSAGLNKSIPKEIYKLIKERVISSHQEEALTTYFYIAQAGVLLDLFYLYLEKSHFILRNRKNTEKHTRSSMEAFRDAREYLFYIVDIYEKISYLFLTTNFEKSKNLMVNLSNYDIGRQEILVKKIKFCFDKLDIVYNHSLNVSQMDILKLKIQIFNGYKNLLSYEELSNRKLKLPFYYEKEEILTSIDAVMNKFALEYKVYSDNSKNYSFLKDALQILKELLRIQMITKDTRYEETKKKIASWNSSLEHKSH